MKLLLVLLLCLNCSSWAEPVAISFWHALQGPRKLLLEQLIHSFQSQHPEIRVELQAFADPARAGNDYAELYRQLLRALEQGQAPVVAQMYENWVTQMAEVQQLVRLDPHLPDLWRDMPEVFLKASSHRDGHRYSVPFNKSLWTLYVNRQLWDGELPPQNWSELRGVCGQLRRDFPEGSLAAPSPIELFTMHFVSQGGHFFEGDRPRFAGPLGMTSGGYVLAFAGQDKSCQFGPRAFTAFSEGKLPFLLETSAKLGQLEAALGERLRVCPLPRGAGDHIQLTGTQLAIFKQSHQGQQQAALILLDYLTSRSQTLDWARSTGYLPVRQSCYDDSNYRSFLQANPARALIATSLHRAQVQPQVVGWESTRNLINDALERSLYQGKPLDQELLRAQATCARLLRGLRGKRPRAPR